MQSHIIFMFLGVIMPNLKIVDDKVKQLHKAVFEAQTIAIIGHSLPDGDAICSALALRNIIKNNCYTYKNGSWKKKKVDVFFDCEKLPDSLELFTKKTDEYVNLKKRPQTYDLVISVDCNNESRMGKYEEIFKKSKFSINLDHHHDNTSFANLNFVTPMLSSTCELIYKIYQLSLRKLYPYEISDYALVQIFAGILTDTNNMQNNADNPSTVKCLSDIISKIGVKQVTKIKEYLFQNQSKAKMALMSFSHDKRFRKYYLDDSICIVNLNYKIFAKVGAELNDAEGIVDSALTMQGVKISILVLEKNKGEFFVKLRGKDLDVSVIASKFGGGGHEHMAGFSFKGNFNSIKYALINECEELVLKSEQPTIEENVKLLNILSNNEDNQK